MTYTEKTNAILKTFNPNEVGRWEEDGYGPDVVGAEHYDTLLELYKLAELELSKIGIQYGVGPYATAPDDRTGSRRLAVIHEGQQ